jgi:hypothetical protein
MQLPKVVICTPTYDKKNYCFDKWFRQYQNLSYPNKSLFMVDNSKENTYFKKLSKLGIKTHHINPRNKPSKQILAESHEACRQYAISIESDYMLHWESDIFCDNSDVIQQLIIAKKPVVNGVYPIRTGAERELNIMLASDDGHLLHNHRHAYHIGESYVNFVDGTVKACFSGGLGLCLIHKSVFQRIKFRFYKDNEMLPDFVFANDLWDLGIGNYVDTGIYCKHDNKEWLK